MSIDYEQLKLFVQEAMFTQGGINEPSSPVGIPHRMPAADDSEKEQDKGDPVANKLYDYALAAREATEKLVEKLDDPFYDDAYENAFKASACLRKALNSLEGSGAHPMPDQRVVAPPGNQQRYNAYANDAGDYFGGLGGPFAMPAGLAEAEGEVDVDSMPEDLADKPGVARIINLINNLTQDDDKKHILTVLNSQGLGQS
jgi:hypothetical protein